MNTDWVKKKYEKRITNTLEAIQRELLIAGVVTSEIIDFADEEYEWSFITLNDDEDKSIDVKFTILDSECREGSDDGISFGIDATGYEGVQVGGLVPFNYTPELWVPIRDKKAIEARFKLLEKAAPYELASIIKKWIDDRD